MKYVVLVLLFFSCAAFSAETGSEGIARAFTHSDKGWDKEIKGVLPLKYTSFDRVALDKSTFSEVKTLYGTAQRYQSDSTATASNLLCYLSPDGHAVIFESNPLGGGTDVTAIIVAGKDVYRNKNCAQSSRIGKTPEIGGLASGLDKSAIESLLGASSYSDERFMVYRYIVVHRAKNNPRAEYHTISGVKIGLSAKGKVNWFKVYWVTAS